MDYHKFEKLVAAGIDGIPKEFSEKLNNVVITIADEPTNDQLGRGRVAPGSTLFGLYEGIPQNRRGAGYTLVLPDKITIFKNPIVAASAGKPERVKNIVRDTVWHEIAHHFGLGEQEVREREQKRQIIDEHEID